MSIGLSLVIIASILGLAAWIWLIVVAFQNQEKIWGILLIVSLILPISPIVGLIFLALKWSIAKRPGILLLSSFAISVLGIFLLYGEAKSAMQELAQNTELEIERAMALNQADPVRARRIEPDTDAPPESPRTPPPPADEPAPPPVHESKPRPPSPPPLAESAPINAVESSPKPVAATGFGSTHAPPPELDSRYSPVKVDYLDLSEPTPNRIRQLRVRASNASLTPVQELKLELAYLDARGLRLGRWTTVHSATGVLVGGGATNEFVLQAFFVPQFTASVKISVEAVAFKDGKRWPEVDSTLGTVRLRP